MMKNRLAAMALTGITALSLAACGGTAAPSTADGAAAESGTAENTAAESGTEESGAADESGAEESASPEAGSGTTYKVGIVQYVDDASLNQIQQNIQSRLDELGQKNGVVFDYADYTYNGQADGTVLQQIASELIADGVDVIVPIATPTAQIMQAATEDHPIPVVFSAVSDPVGAKLAASMDAPGGNITGTSDALNTEAIMNLIFAAQRDADYIGILYSSSEDASTQPVADAKAFLEAKGVRFIEKTGTTNDEVSAAADALIAEGVDAIFTPTDNTIMTAELAIYEKLAEAGIAHYCGADSFALNGAFAGYGVDYAKLGAETADMAAELLLSGADPASTPVRTFDNGIVTINTETAAALGLDLDAVKTAFRPLATQIIETTTKQNFD
ncbi:ABC transporter substrate-binding protein [Lachnoclostridium sp. Marseille-P6806]|uniref:ABC transporter substrate-binding protein n=1 Tax=Lachnoclostridium sp. Marseille-P6806 TaxID=2364793 RepID=UPI00102FD35A|nr:ABC transporter substrate-binding protein [Lachnoclostridium sp. Marseille-P6806]